MDKIQNCITKIAGIYVQTKPHICNLMLSGLGVVAVQGYPWMYAYLFRKICMHVIIVIVWRFCNTTVRAAATAVSWRYVAFKRNGYSCYIEYTIIHYTHAWMWLGIICVCVRTKASMIWFCFWLFAWGRPCLAIEFAKLGRNHVWLLNVRALCTRIHI